FLNQPGTHGSHTWLEVDQLAWNDLSLLRRYCDWPWLLYARWFTARAVPGFSYRLELVRHFAPKWLPPQLVLDRWRGITQYGWVPAPVEAVSAEEYRRGLARTHHEYDQLLRDFQLREEATRALRELIELCRHQHIEIGLFVMPEGSDFRGWYPVEARATIDHF